MRISLSKGGAGTAKIQGETAKALKSKDIAEVLAKGGSEPVGNTTKEATVFLNVEIARWGKDQNGEGRRELRDEGRGTGDEGRMKGGTSRVMQDSKRPVRAERNEVESKHERLDFTGSFTLRLRAYALRSGRTEF